MPRVSSVTNPVGCHTLPPAPFYRWAKRGTEGSSNLSKVTAASKRCCWHSNLGSLTHKSVLLHTPRCRRTNELAEGTRRDFLGGDCLFEGKRNKRQNPFSQLHPCERISPHAVSLTLGRRFHYHLAESHSIASQRTTCLKFSCQEGNAFRSHSPSANTSVRFVLKGECPMTCLCWSNPREGTEGRRGFLRVTSFLDSWSRHCVCTRLYVFTS